MQLQQKYQFFTDKGAEIVALAVAPVSSVEGAKRAAGAEYVMLADPEHEVAEQYGVFNLLGDGYAAPATFVIDTDGQIVWSYVGQNSSDRPRTQDITKNIPESEL